MEVLSKLFGSETKVKVMRLFLFNPETIFETKDVAERVKVTTSKVRRELNHLEKMGLVKKRMAKPGHKGFVLDSQFIYLVPLQNLLISTDTLHPKEITRKITRLGTVKLIIVAGVFIQDPESRADLLIVGDGIKKASLDNTIKTIEAEIGKELRYAFFNTDDFKYRLSMFDKLTRDILDYPHRKILDRLGIE
jgi:hypothetical protein